MSSRFTISSFDTNTAARTGELQTRRGTIATPVFMPVGTQAAVKTVSPMEVRETGASIILANTYHLMLRPGLETIQAAGGLHEFMSWRAPILTDSGGFQVFSLANRRTIRESGVEFRSHLDGRRLELTPERAIDLQAGFGSDIMMPLDVLSGYQASQIDQQEAAELTKRWLDRSIERRTRLLDDGESTGLLFGISQGGFHASFRTRQACETATRDLDGFAIGGLSVGESKPELLEMLEASVVGLPLDRPRYLMGVGSPEDIWEAVSRGVDMFDCVHPTRVARRGAVFTLDGRINLQAARFQRQFTPIDPDCDCIACREFTVAYIHHLFRAGEMLGPRLATIHNLRYFVGMIERIRSAVASGRFVEERNEFLKRYVPVKAEEARIQRARWTASRERKRVSDRGNR